jgi:hypothetical protein
MPKPAVRVAVLLLASSVVASAQIVGPSTTTPPYVLPNADLPPGAVLTKSILTAGDLVSTYRLVGKPDGLGVFSDGGVATLLANHELGSGQGIVRAHGAKGAFVSRWTFDPTTLAVVTGADHATAPTNVFVYDPLLSTWVAGPIAWINFCSADLAPTTAFSFGALGTTERLYLNGEEARPPAPRYGYAWAHVATGPDAGTSRHLPHLGQCAFENAVASPFPQTTTLVMLLDDSDANTDPTATPDPSEVYVYVGAKSAVGNDVERAGLVGGTLYGLRVKTPAGPVPEETNAYGFGAATSTFVGSADFELVSLGDASTFDGYAQQAASITNGVTRFRRPEDGAWDVRPGFENRFYFATTASASNGRLFRLTFADLSQPTLGGTIDILLSGTEGHRNLDNLCADAHGRLLIQEDPGGSSRLAKTWLYDLLDGRFIELAAFDFASFDPSGATFLTTNEESSGIVPAFDLLGDGWYLCSAQVHLASSDPEIVEGGQLYAMYVAPDLGRTFAHWFRAPTGPGSVLARRRFGTPGAFFFSPIALLPGNFPNGAFYGIDLPFVELVTQAFYGPPFSGFLDAAGASTSATYSGVPAGLTLYSVALDDVSATFPKISTPVAFTTL